MLLPASRPHFPLLRRERQSYNNGTLIAAVRFVIFDPLCFVCYNLSLIPVTSNFFSSPGLRSTSKRACSKRQNPKSNCTAASTYSPLHGFLEGYNFLVYMVSVTITTVVWPIVRLIERWVLQAQRWNWCGSLNLEWRQLCPPLSWRWSTCFIFIFFWG